MQDTFVVSLKFTTAV